MAKGKRKATEQVAAPDVEALQVVAEELHRVALAVAMSAVKDATDSEQAYHLYMSGFSPVEVAPRYGVSTHVFSQRVSNVRRDRKKAERKRQRRDRTA